MNHFDYRNGVLHAEAVNLSALAEAVGTPFYCYSTATLERHYRVFTEAFAGEKVLVCYAMKANSNQSVLRTLAKLGAGADVVSGGELKRALAAGIPPQKILFSGVGKTEAELRAALGLRHPLHQRRIRARARAAVAACGRDGQDRAHLGARQSGRRCRHARQDFDRQVREQVRHSDLARRAPSMRAPQSCRESRSPAPTCISAARSPIFPDGNRVPHPGRIRADAARRRPRHLAYRFRRRPRHSLLQGSRGAARARRLCRHGQARHAQSRLHADVRAGPDDRRQCRHPRRQRDLCEARRRPRISSSSMPR